MHTIISSHDDWQTELAPRILLGLWHPRFLPHAEKILPYCRRSYIGGSPTLVKKHFWNSCEVFSMSFASVATYAGERYAFCSEPVRLFFMCLISCSAQRFRNDCKKAGKELMVWTVNEVEHMMEVRLFLLDVIC
jgi:hypothetical protein